MRIQLALLLAVLSMPIFAADPQVKAGGVWMTLPGPSGEFQETGDRLRTTIFELMAPSANRLIDSYLPTQTLADLAAGKPFQSFDSYALIETSRLAEYAECSAQDFEQALKAMEPSMGKSEPGNVTDMETEMNVRLKALGAKPVSVGQPEMLGAMFRKTDAAGFAMLIGMQQGDRSVTMATGFALLRVKNRMLIAYLYHKYESEETVKWIRKNLEAWADLLLAKNS